MNANSEMAEWKEIGVSRRANRRKEEAKKG